MGFRPDIEGLRGVAVLAVVLFHLHLHIAPGGYVGVDVFFVLSGFLITGILYRELKERGRIDVAGFWARRARRILPAAALVLMVTIFIVSRVLPSFVEREARDIAAASLFVVNWKLAAETGGYMAGARHIVLHYWSLAVEEQFYLIWPLALSGVFLLSRAVRTIPPAKLLTIATLSLWVVSFAYCVHLTDADSPYAFLGTASRVWQLLTGALVALWMAEMPPVPQRVGSALGWAGLAGVVASIALFSNKLAYPGWPALLPTLGTVALIVSGNGSAAGAARLLSLPPLRYFGRVSYSWYLWHWPIAALGGNFYGTSISQRVTMFMVSLAAGTLSYYFVENPLRYNRVLVRSSLLSLVGAVALIAVPLGSARVLGKYFSDVRVVLHDGSTISARRARFRIESDGCQIGRDTTVSPPCVYGAVPGAETAVLFGDSHAAQLFPGVAAAAQRLGWRLLVRSKSACPPAIVKLWQGRRKRQFIECETWRANVLEEIAELRPRVVIVASATNYDVTDPVGSPSDRAAKTAEILAEGERRTAASLLRSAGKVVFIADTPLMPVDPIVCLMAHQGHDEACHWPLQTLVPRFPVAAQSLDPRVAVIDLNRDICGGDVCPAVRNGGLLMRDMGHISETSAKALAERFVEIFGETAPPAKAAP